MLYIVCLLARNLSQYCRNVGRFSLERNTKNILGKARATSCILQNKNNIIVRHSCMCVTKMGTTRDMRNFMGKMASLSLMDTLQIT